MKNFNTTLEEDIKININFSTIKFKNQSFSINVHFDKGSEITLGTIIDLKLFNNMLMF